MVLTFPFTREKKKKMAMHRTLSALTSQDGVERLAVLQKHKHWLIPKFSN